MKNLIDMVAIIRDELNAIYEDYDKIDEYFRDVLDGEFFVGFDGDYRGTKVAITLGGPNIYYDSRNGAIIGYWGNDKCEKYVSDDCASILDDYFSMLYY